MGITDKTRKALWAKSGNRCLICRIELVQEVDGNSGNLIIGEECHIISSKERGPRGEIKYNGDFDNIENLVLLCANDHKRVDELCEIYTVEKLKQFKIIHENWVKSTLERDVIAFTNDKNNIKSLPKITTGKQIVDLINGSHMFDFNHDELNTEEEATIIGGFFEEIKDYGDIISEIGFAEISMLGIRYNNVIKNIEQMGFFLFGLRRKIRLRSNKQKDMGVYDSSTLFAVRQDNPSIVGEFLIVKFQSKVSLI